MIIIITMKTTTGLTIKQALEQGYTKYGFSGRDWQTANDLDDGVFEEVPEDQWDDLVLFDKNEQYPSMSAKQMADLLAEKISEDDGEECGRDDDCVYKTVQSFDFSKITAKLNDELKQHRYWMLTDIKLFK
jgi:hypothetical protein